MLQRIQTVYLLIIAGLFLALLFLPLAVLQSGENFYVFNAMGLSSTLPSHELVEPIWAMFALAAIIILVAMGTIFLYKKRILQIRICVFNALLMMGFCGLFAFFLWQFHQSAQLPDLKVNYKFWLSFPIIALILDYLAIRNIGADETLVRSLERLR